MPLSKAKKAELERQRRREIKENRLHVLPSDGVFVPLYPALKEYVEAEARRLGYQNAGEWIAMTLEKKANGYHVQPKSAVEPKANTEQFATNQVVRTTEGAVSNPQSEYIPWYNPAQHVVGQKVRMRNRLGRVEVVMTPETDADGRPMW